ncbi:hypothetical protein [Pedobacter namyangjuensis]|uniref:hypothetical protein n=1 Tax=Pedobacter namyangjuensis TaxID=600626 RepID=UPI000DE3E950|nr:hypothetical protein [Pedobacter namyangjuensis]
MPKNTKTIVCPNCGSTNKADVKPDQFICKSCGSHYFLDDTNVNVNINYNHNNISRPSIAPKNIIVAVVLFIVLFTSAIVGFLLFNQTPKKNLEKEVVDLNFYSGYRSDVIYENTTNNKPVFLRLGKEHLRGDDDKLDLVNIHALYIDPVTKAIINDEVMFERTKRLDNGFDNFEEFNDGSVYIVYETSTLFKLDKANNKLVNVTGNLIKQFKELGSGIAEFDFHGHEQIEIMTNDGEKFFFIPAKNLLFKTQDEAKATKDLLNPFYFTVNDGKLIKEFLIPGSWRTKSEHLAPERKFFEARITYQKDSLLFIASHTVASDQSPTILQRIDVNTGKVLWSLPAKKAEYYQVAKFKNGFGVKYYFLDGSYISGVYTISSEGKILHDYVIQRGK